MPIKHAIWAVGTTPAPLALGRLATEQQLEEMIVADPAILSSEWMLIGRQEIALFAGRIDRLATGGRRSHAPQTGVVAARVGSGGHSDE